MSEDIDYESLEISLRDQIDESLLSKYDFNTILRTAEMVWDDTAVKVTANDFVMIFDLIDYECVEYTGNDM